MSDDVQALIELNLKIADAENRGDREWLASILAPRLAFQRADEARTVDDRIAYLEKVAPGGTRVTRIVEPIEIHGSRAVVKCIVTAGVREFHNLRLFVRRDGQWQLLGWANEPV
ncbi:nuclear transport factor 2 family protein [Nordella sp. HKS 07]|uniref:nuclear transport factor 2 family protein n=1 Tax=Nordella sp. HKS 07 TaxID=2712222 RepID=UPI0013E1EAB1|nr:nuclear transport factor 2 family protein [Nordella sp. HKS 07]QIG49951.1 nuclear transport factor 2 family protein [Nordella sp. HKS 07]